MKWRRKILKALLVSVTFCVAFLSTSYFLARKAPKWYRPALMTRAQINAAANRALKKFADIHNMADQAAATDSSREWRKQNGSTTLPNVSPVEITFTQEELTGFLTQWIEIDSEKVAKYIAEPQFLIDATEIKFAAHVKELDQIGVLRLRPKVAEVGGEDLLYLDLAGFSAGSMPLPEALVQGKLQKIEASLNAGLTGWQNRATLTAEGANADAVRAAMSKMFLQLLHHEPSLPVLFMPIDKNKLVPVKIKSVSLQSGSITLRVDPLTAEDRKAALESIQKPMKP